MPEWPRLDWGRASLHRGERAGQVQAFGWAPTWSPLLDVCRVVILRAEFFEFFKSLIVVVVLTFGKVRRFAG